MGRATECRQCGGLAAGLAEKCPGCGRWLRKQDFYATRAATHHQDRVTRVRRIRGAAGAVRRLPDVGATA